MSGTIIEQFSMACTENGSDKLYHGQLVQEGDGYLVNFQFGARAKPLKPGTKTAAPVDEKTARSAYAKMLNERIKKGYKPLDDADAPQYRKIGDIQKTGYSLQFSTEVGEDDLHLYLEDSDFDVQLKANGEYRTLNKRTNPDGTVEVFGGNSNSDVIPLRTEIADALLAHPADNIQIHGEDMGDHVLCFDLTWNDVGDLRTFDTVQRFDALRFMVRALDTPFIRLIERAEGFADKMDLLSRVIAANLEGVVFKRRTAPYTPGKATSHAKADHVKYKLKATAYCVVSGHTKGKRSVKLSMWDQAGYVDVGAVTIPEKHDLPEIDRIVEIDYLYVANVGGCLYQPVYKGIRNAKCVADCDINTLKYHAKETGT